MSGCVLVWLDRIITNIVFLSSVVDNKYWIDSFAFFQVNISLLVRRILVVSVDIQFQNFVNNVFEYSFKGAI